MRHSENESGALIPKENQQTLQLKQQSVISQAIYINLKTITDGNAKIAKNLLSDNNSDQKQSPDEHLMSLLKEMVEGEENVQAESVEVDFFTRLADICFRLSRLYIDSSEGGDVERLFDYLPQLFYDPAVPLDDEDEQQQLYEITDDYYSFFKFCMSFMTSYFFKNVSSQVVEQVRTNLKKLLEDSVFCNGLIQAVEQDAKKGEPVEGWLEYLYPLKNNDTIISAALFYLRGCPYAPTPPRTLDCVPAQSKEIDIQQTMLVTVADVLELMNNFLCGKLKPFRFFCRLNYDFNQEEKKDIETYYFFLNSNAIIRTAISEGNPLPLIGRIWRLEGLIKEFDFLKKHKAFNELFHSEWRKQEAKLEKVRAIIDKEYQKIICQKEKILLDIRNGLEEAELDFELPEEITCAITKLIMSTPVYYSPSQEREGDAQENKGEVQEREGDAQESKGEDRIKEIARRYVYEKASIEKTFKRQKDLGQPLKHPHCTFLVKETDFVEDKALKDKIEIFIAKTWKEYKQEQASLARSVVPGQ